MSYAVIHLILSHFFLPFYSFVLFLAIYRYTRWTSQCLSLSLFLFLFDLHDLLCFCSFQFFPIRLRNKRRFTTNKFNPGSMSRMNLQSTGSFVPKKFAALGSSGGTGSSSSWSSTASPSTMKKTKESSKSKSKSKSSGNGLSHKEQSMLVMLGIEDDPLICVRSQDIKGTIGRECVSFDSSI